MAWVFFVGDRVFKLKKPVRYPYLDFSTLEARHFACSEELRLNRELSPEVYIGLRALRKESGGRLSLSGSGSIVDWLVEMNRLPADRMLDELIESRSADTEGVKEAAKRLGQFYAKAVRVPQLPGEVFTRFRSEFEQDEHVLHRQDFAIDHGLAKTTLASMQAALSVVPPLIERRVEAHAYLEGHGDLRPEHICLTKPAAFIDRLEFNRDLRIVDPYDELAFLALECERLGDAAVGNLFFAVSSNMLKLDPPAALLTFYRASRALLRARLALVHLLEPNPRTPEKWEPRAQQYLILAHQALQSFQSFHAAAGR